MAKRSSSTDRQENLST